LYYFFSDLYEYIYYYHLEFEMGYLENEAGGKFLKSSLDLPKFRKSKFF